MQRIVPLLLIVTACGSATTADTAITTTTVAPTTSTTVTTVSTTTTTLPPATTTTTVGYEFPYDFSVVDTVIEPGEWDQSWTAVPTVVIGDDGTWYLFYSGDGGRRVPSRLGLATSADGTAWEKVTVDRSAFAPPDNISVGWLAARQNDDGTWQIWFTGGFSLGHRRIYTATAPEPAGPWEYGGTAIETFLLPDWASRIVVTGLTVVDGQLWMTFGAWDTDDNGPTIGILTSDDGVTWETTAEPILAAQEDTWFASGVNPSNVVQTERGLELLFIGTDRGWGGGINDDIAPYLIGRLISVDGGETWLLDNDGEPIASTEEKGWPGVATVYRDGRYFLYLGHELGFSGINLITGTIP